jgi:hypothetical protein
MRRYVVRVALDQRVDMVLCDVFIALLALQETTSALYILSIQVMKAKPLQPQYRCSFCGSQVHRSLNARFWQTHELRPSYGPVHVGSHPELGHDPLASCARRVDRKRIVFDLRAWRGHVEEPLKRQRKVS